MLTLVKQSENQHLVSFHLIDDDVAGSRYDEFPDIALRHRPSDMRRSCKPSCSLFDPTYDAGGGFAIRLLEVGLSRTKLP
nr:hypothetical protein [Enterovirga sp. DB1703]